MRILYLQTFPLSGSGSGTYARELAEEMAKNHTVAMVAPDKKRKIPGVKMYPVELPVKIAFTGHPEWPGCMLYAKAPAKDFTENYMAFYRATIHAVNDFKPDIIHVHHLMPLAWIARFIKHVYGINYIVTGHGSELPTMEQDKRYIAPTIEALAQAARIVPNSYWTREWMHAVLKNRWDTRTRVIPGGVNMVDFPEEKRQEYIDDVNKKYKFFPEWKLVMFSGKLTKYKGVKYLIQAAKRIDGIICIVGDGPERKELEGIVKDYGITNVKFFGHKEKQDLVKLYYRADVSVVPSIWDEPLGLVILEAMATKTPVVVTRKGGAAMMINEGVNGFLIRARNSQEIADVVNMLLADDKLRLKVGTAARKTVAEKFSWEKIGKRFEKIYESARGKEKQEALPIESFMSRLLAKK